jgi:hypothetical protein
MPIKFKDFVREIEREARREGPKTIAEPSGHAQALSPGPSITHRPPTAMTSR